MSPAPPLIQRFRLAVTSRRRPSWLNLAVIVWLVITIIVPLATLVLGSLRPTGATLFSGELTFSNYTTLFQSAGFKSGLVNTLITSGGGAIIAVLIGTWLAFLIARTNVPFKGLITLTGVVPFFVSAFVHAFAWSALADPRVGILNQVFRALNWPLNIDVNSLTGIAFVLGLYHVPFVFLFVVAALHTVDPMLEEAARTAGAGVWNTLRKVTLPLVAPAMLSGGVLVFALMAGNFAIPSLLGTPANLDFITPYIYRMMQFAPPRYGLAAATGVILLVITLVLFMLQRSYVGRRQYSSVGGKGFRPRLVDLGRWKGVILASIGVYWLLAVILPLLAIVARASRRFFFIQELSDLWNPELMSWANFTLLWEYNQVPRAIQNTLFLGIASALIGGLLYFLIGYAAEKLNGNGSPVARYLSMLPSAVPGMVLGLSYLWIALYMPLPLYGTIWILLLSYLARFVPQGVGSVSSALRNIHPDLEDSARVAGAGRVRRLQRIIVPLSKQGIIAAMILGFVLGVTELHTSILLYTSQTIVLPVVMYEFWQFGDWSVAAALSLIQSLIIGIIIFVSTRLFGVGIGGVPVPRKEGS